MSWLFVVPLSLTIRCRFRGICEALLRYKLFLYINGLEAMR